MFRRLTQPSAKAETDRERERRISLMTTALVLVASAGTFGLTSLLGM
ncbi:hypothetical protein [Frondihabitans cladoniiphilus]|uniref:Uncharacterized protein n=1 Tax=Frondihabitans cladoniiphilus TaxID=715785 RepID=A0ABP8W9H5_9MICO